MSIQADNILNLELGEFCIETKFLDDTHILAACKVGIILRLGTSDDHLAWGKVQSGCFCITDMHDDCHETLDAKGKKHSIMLSQGKHTQAVTKHRIILCIMSMQCNHLEVQTTVKVDSRHDVLQCGHNALDRDNVLLFECEWCRCCGYHCCQCKRPGGSIENGEVWWIWHSQWHGRMFLHIGSRSWNGKPTDCWLSIILIGASR